MKICYAEHHMRNHIWAFALMIVVLGSLIAAPAAEARGRTGSHRVGGYTSHGKGSHYYGGYVRSGPALRRR